MMLECGCPADYPDWDGQDIELGGVPILLLPIPTFLHMPMGFDIYVARLRQMTYQLEIEERWPGFLMSRTGWFRGQLINLITNPESPSRHVTRFANPHNVRVKLHHGNISTIRTSMREIQAGLLDSGKIPKELYLAHLTCPRCEEERGGDKIMILRTWKESPRLVQRIENR